LAATAAAACAEGTKKWPGRLGIVVLQFDDGSVGHYTHGFRILEKYGLKGSFGPVTGGLDKTGRLSGKQVQEMHRAGHEIHDHTFDHNAAFWGDPANRAAWIADIEKSRAILGKLGIATRGWNHPGGKGSRWTQELRDTLRPYFDYVAGRVNLRPEEMHNIHWNLKDDPFSLGYGGLGSWHSTQADASRVAEEYKTRIADAVQQGLVTIPLWHVLKDEDGTVWGLEEICKFVRQNRLPVMRMADAVRAIQHSREYFDAEVDQIPNPGFLADYDNNGRPDGYQGCHYAPASLQTPSGARAALIESGASTWIYGPEPGRTRFSLAARSTDGRPCKLTPVVTMTEIDGSRQYHFGKPRRLPSLQVAGPWSEFDNVLDVGPDVDRVKIELDVSPPGKVFVAGLSWRKVPAGPQARQYRWQEVSARAAFAPRDGAGALVFQDKMWLLGGWNPSDKTHFPKICNSEVWSSRDGTDWKLHGHAPWEGRHTAGYAVHQGKMWIVGGDANQRHYQPDVWNSADGVNWTCVCREAPWGKRVLHHTVAFGDKIWVLGGQAMPRFAPDEEAFYNDVWSSADGVHWTRVSEHAPWPPRGMIGGSAVLNDRIWLLGGGTYDTPKQPTRKFYNDVWSSADGLEWTCHTREAPWAPRQYHEVAAFDGRLWVLEGYGGKNRNDVWHSADGSHWEELPRTLWAPRHAASVFVFNGGLWMVAGNNMQSDVWKLVAVE